MAGFFYEELTWPHFTMQFGGRVDHTTYRPGGTLPDREFTEYSTSIGALFRPQAASDNLVVAFSLARAARNPALEELYFFGNHAGNLTFEIGNPDLNSEKALGFDVSVRGRSNRMQTSVTVFRNRVDDFIFRNPLSDEEFAARQDEFADRFGIDPGDLPAGEFPYVEFIGTDATMWGAEAHADITLTERFGAEWTYDFVRASRDVDGQPMPRIPPQRLTAGLRYTQGPLQVGGSVDRRGPPGPRLRPGDRDRVLRPAAPLRHLHDPVDALGADGDRPPRQRHQHALPESPELHQGHRAGDGPGVPPGLYRQVLMAGAGAAPGWRPVE